MKSTVQRSIMMGFGVLLALAADSGARAAEIRDRISPDALRKRQQTGGLPANFAAPREPDARVKTPAGQSIIAQSKILSDGTYWTLVPVGAVLHVPEGLSAHLPEQPSGELLQWQQFLARNRGWLSTEEVDFETAAGKKPISEETTTAWTKRGAIVVAVHRGGAISVNTPTPEPADKPTPEAP